MKTFTTPAALSDYLYQQKLLGRKIGFVPTMGALHQGHLSLIDIAKTKTELVVCSIFVNPTQFNDPKDLERYPRPIASDIEKLEAISCDVLFLPETREMYNGSEQWHLDLDGLDEILEGKIRPGHYQGVVQIVNKLFEIVQPEYAFFGQKDYQQFRVIAKMLEKLKMTIKLVMCPIVRETDGLAMSSRNMFLSEEERKHAPALYHTLNWLRTNFGKLPLEKLKQEAVKKLQQSEGIELEYLEICRGNDLTPAISDNEQNLIALVAAKVGKTRLIDNMILN